MTNNDWKYWIIKMIVCENFIHNTTCTEKCQKSAQKDLTRIIYFIFSTIINYTQTTALFKNNHTKSYKRIAKKYQADPATKMVYKLAIINYPLYSLCNVSVDHCCLYLVAQIYKHDLLITTITYKGK